MHCADHTKECEGPFQKFLDHWLTPEMSQLHVEGGCQSCTNQAKPGTFQKFLEDWPTTEMSQLHVEGGCESCTNQAKPGTVPEISRRLADHRNVQTVTQNVEFLCGTLYDI